MPIKNIKLEYLTEQIVKNQVANGKLPTSFEAISELIIATSKQDLSRPFFKFGNFMNNEVIGSVEYSEYLDNILKDLKVIYKNFLRLEELLERSTFGYEVEKERLELQLQKLEDQLRNKIILSSDSSTLHCIYDTFTDSKNVNDILTDAKLNLVNHEITLDPKSSSHVTRDYIRDMSFYVKPMFKSTSTRLKIGALRELLQGGYCTYEVTSHEDGNMGVVLEVDFTNIVSLNGIELELQTSKPIYMLVTFSPDGLNHLNIPYNEEPRLISGKTSISFPEMKIKTIYIELTKTEADSGEYNYLFGLKNLIFNNTGYRNSGTFVSQPLFVDNPDFVINQVALEVEEVKPLGTEIEYYLALNNQDAIWYRISPSNASEKLFPTVIDFRNIADEVPTVFKLDSGIAIRERALPNLKTNGINFYSLGSIGSNLNPIKIIPGSEKLYKGLGSWEMQIINNSQEGPPRMDDWFGKVSKKKYIPIGQSRLVGDFEAEEPQSYKFTTFVYCNQPISFSGLPACNFPISVYVNTKLVYEDDGETINYVFNKGFNRIDILAHKEDPDTNLTLNLNVDLVSKINMAYASKDPMKIVSLFDLQHKVPITDHNSYAITQINDRNVIVVNDIVPDLDYEFHYKYNNNDTDDGLLFKAVLRKEELVKTSPKLKSYRIKLM